MPRASRVAAQQTAAIAPQAFAQIAALSAQKAARTPEQRKISAQLIYASKIARGEPIADGVPTLQVDLPDVNTRGAVLDIRVDVSQPVLNQFVALGAELLDVSIPYSNVRLRIDLNQVDALAAIPEVSFIQQKQEAMTSRLDALQVPSILSSAEGAGATRARKRVERMKTLASIRGALLSQGPITSVGSRNSEGDFKHSANTARTAFDVTGAGVKIGVLSDGATNLAASQALGDLGAVNVLSGQAGAGDEGTAMLEIIHDLAPKADLYFATAITSIASFAQNIRDLRAAGCDIIVDDVGYLNETPFQDGQTVASQTNGGIVIQAVKDVTANGALYFSSAANSGNKNDGTSGTWEGDFVDGGPATGPLAGLGQVHNFGAQTYNVLAGTVGNPIALFWADPLGASNSDYDLYRLNSTGTAVLAASDNSQNGTQDPFEIISGGSAGDRIVIVKWSGNARFLHLATNRNRLSISTAGETHGHAATTALTSLGVAATTAQVGSLFPFNNFSVVEPFSSDGPRRIFFQGNGVPITPGNFTSSGGQVLQKPDITAADGVTVTGVGGFPSPFYGTSAAAPHAAAIAGLIKSKFPGFTASQIRAALLTSAIDIEGAGVDRDSGYGIIMADAALGGPVITTQPISQSIPYSTTTTLIVAATGSGPLSYQWYQGTSGDTTSPIAGATAASFVTFPANATTSYWVLVSNAFGSVNSTTATIALIPGPYISSHPSSSLIAPWGGTATLNVVVLGQGTLSYQWYQGTSGDFTRPISGANSEFFTTLPQTTSTNYWVHVTDASGSTDSTTARVATGIAGAGTVRPTDFDGDGTPDTAVWRPSTGAWWIVRSSNGSPLTRQWGFTGDVPVAGDYDGDNRTDIAIWRPSTGAWWVIRSSDSQPLTRAWGMNGDIPVPGDYDGDGKTDPAVWRQLTGEWWVLKSSDGQLLYQLWGHSGDIPVAGDYDGDGKTDMAVWRPTTGTWFLIKSSNSQVVVQAWGMYGDTPVPGDFDGDNKTDFAVWRGWAGIWFVIRSSDGAVRSVQWGLESYGDRPVSGTNDNDGDGMTDPTIWRAPNGAWYGLDSSTNYTTAWQLNWGISTDVPVVD